MTKQFIRHALEQDSRFEDARKIVEDFVMLRDQHAEHRELSTTDASEFGMFKVIQVLYITIHGARDLTWGRSKVPAMNSFAFVKVGNLHPIAITRVASKMMNPTWNAEFHFCLRSFRQSEHKDAAIVVQVWQQPKPESEARLLGQVELSLTDAHEHIERRRCKLTNPRHSSQSECGHMSISLRFVCF